MKQLRVKNFNVEWVENERFDKSGYVIKTICEPTYSEDDSFLGIDTSYSSTNSNTLYDDEYDQVILESPSSVLVMDPKKVILRGMDTQGVELEFWASDIPKWAKDKDEVSKDLL